jgi:hypothetical protein
METKFNNLNEWYENSAQLFYELEFNTDEEGYDNAQFNPVHAVTREQLTPVFCEMQRLQLIEEMLVNKSSGDGVNSLSREELIALAQTMRNRYEYYKKESIDSNLRNIKCQELISSLNKQVYKLITM